jgi:hypothetical protein
MRCVITASAGRFTTSGSSVTNKPDAFSGRLNVPVGGAMRDGKAETTSGVDLMGGAVASSVNAGDALRLPRSSVTAGNALRLPRSSVNAGDALRLPRSSVNAGDALRLPRSSVSSSFCCLSSSACLALAAATAAAMAAAAPEAIAGRGLWVVGEGVSTAVEE